MYKRPKGLDAGAHHIAGYYRRRHSVIQRLNREAHKIDAQAKALQDLSEGDLNKQMEHLIEEVNRAPLEARGALDEALALIVECARRALGKRPYIMQIMGALALHRGYLAEMATGEGKTLTIGLAGVLAGWSGRPCQILTANDYLAERDTEEIRPLYDRCGVSVAACLQEMEPHERAAGYRCDLAYVTPKTLLADYLRDALAQRARGGELEERVLPQGLHSAIVDEADSMLIDEAITPLIISAPREVPGLHEAVEWARDLSEKLEPRHDYRPLHAKGEIQLLRDSSDIFARLKSLPPRQWRSTERRTDLLLQALKVREFFIPSVQYVVDENKIVLIDEFTGRLTPERSLSSGLHQAIEARERVPFTDPNLPLVQMTFQRFFQQFKRLSGVTGTAHEAAAEFWHFYHKAVVRIPTNRPRQVIYTPLSYFRSHAEKFDAIVDLALSLSRTGVPVLIGVRNVAQSAELSRAMDAAGLPHETLNALNHKYESAIIKSAGQPSAVTIATNMAGRGVDIRLPPEVLARGGLNVVIAEHNDSMRVDRQLAGRCGRQGSHGRVHRFVSLDDKLFSQQLSRLERFALHLALSLPATLARPLLEQVVKLCQSRFERKSFQNRKALLETEEWLDSALPFNIVD